MKPTLFRPIPACALLLVAGAAWAGPDGELSTLAEQTAFARTGRYEEVGRLCRAYENRWPSRARCFDAGLSPEHRTLWALAASNDGVLTPEQARTVNRPVLLLQGGIHAGEIDGKDAGFMAVREMLEQTERGAVLDAVTVVFVPVFNVDGHERFGAWNRPNQAGPEEMGWRTTAQNLNLNRDYMKADAPEMQAMLRLLNDWDPLVYADLHVTDGADFQEEISIETEPSGGGDAGTVALAIEVRDRVLAHLRSVGALALPYYPSFVVEDDPASGFAVTPSLPRYSTGYWGTRNRIGMLVETHSWKDYPRRVTLTLETIRGLVSAAAVDGARWKSAVDAADTRESHLDGAGVPLAYTNTDDVRTVQFRGYKYERSHSEISDSMMTRYDPSRPEVWNLPMRDRLRPIFEVPAPRSGYVVPPAVAAWLAPKLALHGIRTEALPAGLDVGQISAWRADQVALAQSSFEGRVLTTLKGHWSPEAVTIAEGSLFVPIAQPKARLLMALLEPEAPDSLAAWGFFASAFEKKEYMEPYVAERIAREMLDQDPVLRREFEKRLRDDAAFAAAPELRLEFFFRRHASWDTRHGLYPVLRLE